MKIVAILIAVAFVVLAVLHIYWALGGEIDIRKVIPVVEGKPVFTPGVLGTFIVAGVLICFAIGAVLVLRAIGEFRYVGFFKRVRGSDFATYDNWFYSPFCLLVGSAFLFLAANQT